MGLSCVREGAVILPVKAHQLEVHKCPLVQPLPEFGMRLDGRPYRRNKPK